ncbi:MAG: hypothetical protein GY830_08190 [Bacteroidetes bacterium]|nr:hypothetical protein [Bacteroidota bacterium]
MINNLDFFKYIECNDIEKYEEIYDLAKYSISIYDQLQIYKEYDNVLCNYSQIHLKKFKLEKYLEYENKYIVFFNQLYSMYDVYTFDIDYDFTKKITKVTSKNQMNKIVEVCLRDKRNYNFVIPQLKCIILSNIELTFPVYIKEHQKQLLNIINEADLYLVKGILYED